MDKDPFRESAIIAYYAIFSLPGLFVVIITLAGIFFGREAVNEQILHRFYSSSENSPSVFISERLTLHPPSELPVPLSLFFSGFPILQ